MAGHSRREEQGTSFGWTQSGGCLLACTFDGKCGSLAQECDGVPVSRLLDGCLLQLAQQADPRHRQADPRHRPPLFRSAQWNPGVTHTCCTTRVDQIAPFPFLL